MIVRLSQRIGLALGLMFAASSWAVPAARASTLCVNQGGTGGCFGTITAAISAAANGDTIRIAGAASPYLERLTLNKSLSLVGDSAATTIIDGSAGGQVIRITTPVTVTLTNLTIRNGQAGSGDLSDQYGGGIHSEKATLTLNSTIVSGNQTGGGNACCGGSGGGISSDQGNLTLNNSTVSGNATGSATDNNVPDGEGGSGGAGGGIYVQNGTLTLNNSTVSGNATGNGAHGGATGGPGGQGGGIGVADATVTLNNSTVSGNTTGNGGTGGSMEGNGGSGGGIYDNVGTLTLNDSTIIGNQTGVGATVTATSGSGGGLSLRGFSLAGSRLVTVNTSTISGNATGRGVSSSGGDGGGIYTTAGITLTVADATLAFNVVDGGQKGGGIANTGGVVNIKNSLFAHNHNTSGDTFLQDCSGTINSLGYNLMMEPDCTITPGPDGTNGDLFFVRGQIVQPLANNGGPTLTNALPPGSPAIDAADNSTCPPTDQRGLPRPAFGGIALRCDVGAFELYRFGVRLPLLVR